MKLKKHVSSYKFKIKRVLLFGSDCISSVPFTSDTKFLSISKPIPDPSDALLTL